LARRWRNRALCVAGGAEGLATALLPAEDEPATVLGLGQGASQILALEALPLKRRVVPVGTAVYGDLIEHLALTLDSRGNRVAMSPGLGISKCSSRYWMSSVDSVNSLSATFDEEHLGPSSYLRTTGLAVLVGARPSAALDVDPRVPAQRVASASRKHGSGPRWCRGSSPGR